MGYALLFLERYDEAVSRFERLSSLIRATAPRITVFSTRRFAAAQALAGAIDDARLSAGGGQRER